MTTWHWVRHGPTHQKSLVGWRDVPADLSDHDRIARLSAHLPETGLLVSSDLIRAVATADRLALPSRDRRPHDRDFREMNFGSWDGMHASDVSEQHPDLARAFWTEPGDIAPPDGESWNQAMQRVNASVDRMKAAHPDAHIIAVAHFGVILTQLQRAMAVDAKTAMGHKIDTLSVTELRFDAGHWTVGGISHTP